MLGSLLSTDQYTKVACLIIGLIHYGLCTFEKE